MSLRKKLFSTYILYALLVSYGFAIAVKDLHGVLFHGQPLTPNFIEQIASPDAPVSCPLCGLLAHHSSIAGPIAHTLPPIIGTVCLSFLAVDLHLLVTCPHFLSRAPPREVHFATV